MGLGGCGAARAMASGEYVSHKFTPDDSAKLEEFEKRVNPNDRDQVNLLEEMRAHIKKLEDMRSGFSPTASRRTSTSRWSGPTCRSTPGRLRCLSSWRSPSTWTATRGPWTRTESRP